MPGTRPSVASPVQYQYIENVAVSALAIAAMLSQNNATVRMNFMIASIPVCCENKSASSRN
jgi:hypothetical protein